MPIRLYSTMCVLILCKGTKIIGHVQWLVSFFRNEGKESLLRPTKDTRVFVLVVKSFAMLGGGLAPVEITMEAQNNH